MSNETLTPLLLESLPFFTKSVEVSIGRDLGALKRGKTLTLSLLGTLFYFTKFVEVSIGRDLGPLKGAKP